MGMVVLVRATWLEANGSEWIYHNSAMTWAGLFESLQRNPKAVHVFDDMEQLYSDKAAIGYLRSATWGDHEMRNRILTRTKHKVREEFEFHGGIIIISNLPLGDIPTLKALATRLHPAEYKPTEVEKEAMMRKIASKGKFGLSAAICFEVCEFIIEYSKKRGKPLDFRLLDNGIKDRLMFDQGQCQTDWSDLVASRIDSIILEPVVKPRTRKAQIKDELDIARQLYEKYPNSREARNREWMSLTGKSERALYRRGSELGNEPKIKVWTTDDLEDFMMEESGS